MAQFQVQHLPPPTTRDTALMMRQLAHQGKVRIPVRQLATEITRYVADKDYKSEALAIYRWVKKNIRYRKDPYNVEMVQGPEVTLQTMAADCDDLSILIGALLLSLGHRVRFTTVGFNAKWPHSHVLPEVQIGQRWLILDPVAGVKTREMASRVRTRTNYYL